MTRPTPQLGIVVPCWNEEQVLPGTATRLAAELRTLVSEGLASEQSRIYFIDDGSTDASWRLIAELVDGNGPFVGIRLTRNFGHQYALYAGLMEAEGDALISLDADLQDDIGVMRQMLLAYNAGSDIVYGVRVDRASDTRWKRLSADAHYRLSELIGIGTIRHHADFRLMSRRAVRLLGQFRETNIYLRGIIPMLGLPSSVVSFKRAARTGGRSKYGMRKMISLALRGLTSFSIMPLRFIAAMGFIVFIASLGLGAWALNAALWGRGVVPGWASTVIPIYLLGGLQLLAIGVAGEYIGKTYMEVKNRPLYLIDEVLTKPVKPIGMSATDTE